MEIAAVMDIHLETAKLLHQEHMAVRELLQRTERTLLAAPADPPPAADPGPMTGLMAGLLAELGAALENEVTRHFAFEELQVFPRLKAAGEHELPALLHEEHEVIRPLGHRVSTLARQARADGFDAASWKEFRATTLELAHLLLEHIEKEEMGLVPAVDDMLDEAADAEIMTDFAMS